MGGLRPFQPSRTASAPPLVGCLKLFCREQDLKLHPTVSPQAAGSGGGRSTSSVPPSTIICQAARGVEQEEFRAFRVKCLDRPLILPLPKLSQILIEACEAQSPTETILRVFWKIETDNTPCREEDESNSRLTKPSGPRAPGHPAEGFSISVLPQSSPNPDLIKRKPKGQYYLASIWPLEI